MQVMGVVNVTDDSFSDGGRYLDIDHAVQHGLTLVAQGAAIVDVGGVKFAPGPPVPGEAVPAGHGAGRDPAR